MRNDTPGGYTQAPLFMNSSQDRSLMYITVGVLALHCLALFFAYLDIGSKPPPPPPPQRLVVQTIALQEKSVPRTQAVYVEPEPLPPKEPEESAPAEIKPEPPPPPPPPEPEPVAEAEKPEPVEPEKPKAPEPEPEKPKPPEPVKPKAIEPAKPKVEKKKTKPEEKKKPKPAPAPKKKAQPEKKPEPKKPVKKPAETVKPKKDPAPKEAPAKPKPVAEKPKAAPKPSPPQPDPKVEAAKAKKKALLEQAQKSIAKIGQSRDKVSSGQSSFIADANIPAQIESLHVEALVGDPGQSLSKQEMSYQGELAGRLKLLLRMPEYGEVKIKLTLERSGKYVSVAIVAAESSANRKYVEKTLPKLQYPSFGSNFGSDPQYTFVIVLSNDI